MLWEPLMAQQPVTLADAIAAALTTNPRTAISRADSAAFAGAMSSAKAWPNPTAIVGYSKAVPQYHAVLDFPIDYPWLRGARGQAAEEGLRGAGYRSERVRATIRFDVEVAYTQALATQERARISRRTADDADSLLMMARARRDAGDASELDVLLATMAAGQLTNAALSDSAAAISAILAVQQLMGLSAGAVSIVPTDTLALPPDDGGTAAGPPLTVAEAEATLAATESALKLEKHRPIPAPSVQVGLEGHDPTGGEPGLLPIVGLAIPLPLFNQSGGEIAMAEANQERARAELAQVRQQNVTAVSAATRDLRATRERAERGRDLAETASRVAAMARTAYGEGAVALPYVLEAERSAREAINQYTADLAAAITAGAALRLLNASVPTP
jgi:cobalt-zinc-cadmium efflux system outer membrane protein